MVLTYSRSGIAITVLAALAWVLLSGAAFETLAVLALAGAAAAPVLLCAFLSPGITSDGEPYAVRVDDGMIFAPVLLAAWSGRRRGDVSAADPGARVRAGAAEGRVGDRRRAWRSARAPS